MTQPLLGADFLSANTQLVDVKGQRVVDPTTHVTHPLLMTSGSAHGIHNLNYDGFSSLLTELPDILTPTFANPTVKHGVVHYILTVGPPTHARARRFPPEKLALTRGGSMKDVGVIRRSSMDFSTTHGSVNVWQSETMWRLATDGSTTLHTYRIPLIPDLSANLSGATIFSKVDFARGYHQIPARPADVPKTAIITPIGLFEFLRMPFGLKNATHAFQCLMDTACRGLNFVFVHLDDILIFSRSEEAHRDHLRQLFTRLQ